MTDETPNVPDNMIAAPDPKFLKSVASRIKSLGKKLHDNAALAKVAGATRATWLDYGAALADAREVLKSNNAFNGWLKENELEAYADRNTRTDAMWLTTIADELIDDVCPSELHSPKAIRNWYRNTLKRLVEVTGGDTTGPKAEALDPIDGQFVMHVATEDWTAAVAKFKEHIAPVKFKDMTIPEAVSAVIDKINSHPQAGALLAAMREGIDRAEAAAVEAQAKAEAEAEAKAEAEAAAQAEADEAARVLAEAEARETPAEVEGDAPEGDDAPNAEEIVPVRRRRGA